MASTTNPGRSGPLRGGGGSHESPRAFARRYDFWIRRFQAVDGDFITRAKRTGPPGDFETFAVGLALAMQRKRDKDLREQGTRGLHELAATGSNLARYNLAVQQIADGSQQASGFELMSAVANSETKDLYLKGLATAGVGECFLHGRGVERDIGKAHELFEKAAELNVAEAAFNVGLYHDDRRYDPYRGPVDCGPVDLRTAARYYKMGADLGHVPSVTKLGILYAARRAEPPSQHAGWELLERAAALGDAVAANAIREIHTAASRADSPQDLGSILFTRM